MSSLSGTDFQADLPSSADASAKRESALLKKAQNGDRSAYGELVIAYQDRLYNALLRVVGEPDEARDLTQEAFTRGLTKLETFRGDAAPYTWLFRIAVNAAISQIRRVQRHRTFSLDGHARAAQSVEGDGQASSLLDRIAKDSGDGPHEQLERRELQQHVLEAMGRLDAEYRAILVMRDIEGFDYQQMAEVLDLPLGTLKSRLFRARVALRDEMLPYMKK